MGNHTRVFDEDPLTNTTTLFHWDDTDKSFTLEEQVDVTDIVEQNLLHRNNVDERARFGGDMVRVASIPNVILMDLDKRGITKDKKAFMRWLNDRDNAAFRVRSGRV